MQNVYDKMKAENAQNEAKKARVNLYTTPDTKEKLQTIADYEGRSLNQQINKALTEWLADFERQAAGTVDLAATVTETAADAAAEPQDAVQPVSPARIDWAGINARDPEEIGLSEDFGMPKN